MPLWPFKKKQETERTLEIHRSFYLSVLAGHGGLPTLLQIVNPDGSNSALKGFGVPLAQGASKDLLNQQIAAGAYALTTPDKLTIIQMTVSSLSDVKEFQLPSNQRDLEATDLIGEKYERARKATHIISLFFKGYNPDVLASVEFLLGIASRIGKLTNGVVADIMAESYRLPEELRISDRLDPRVDFREIATIKAIRLGDGVWVSTRGLSKFNLPEYEMYGIPDDLVDTAFKMLVAAGQQTLLGVPLRAGESAYSVQYPMEIAEGTKQRDAWGDRETLEISDPNEQSAKIGVQSWKDQGN